jgi:hypothetical protein
MIQPPFHIRVLLAMPAADQIRSFARSVGDSAFRSREQLVFMDDAARSQELP